MRPWCGVAAVIALAGAASAIGAPTAPVRACSLVTKLEVASALELPGRKLKRVANTDFLPDWDCTYTEAKAGLKRRPREFSLMYRDYTDDPATYDGLIHRRFSRDRKQPGLGEAAFWTLDHDLVFFVRGRMMRIDLFGFGRAKSEPRMKALARKAIRRLPA